MLSDTLAMQATTTTNTQTNSVSCSMTIGASTAIPAPSHPEIKPLTVPRSPRPITDSTSSFDLAGKRLFFIGIGGSGMSGLAQMFAGRGAIVSGSDREASDVTSAMEKVGIKVYFDQSKQWLPEETDCVIASAAITPEHPQMLEADRRGLEVLLYAQALGTSMLGRTGVAIAGTHGKSTTTAMLGCALTDAGLDPSVIVGATCGQLAKGTLVPRKDQTATGFRLGAAAIAAGSSKGKPGVLVAEACEYNRSFHHLHPTIACINNVEADHLDVYGTLDAVVESFRDFASLLPAAKQGGKLLIGHDGAHRREICGGLACEVQTIGFSPAADWVVGYEPSTRKVTLTHRGSLFASWINTLAGAHNASNAANAFVMAHWLGADTELVAKSLSQFTGADRRMQLMGERVVGGGVGSGGSGGVVRVFDDYAHHPTEIDTTLRAFRESEAPQNRGGRLVCIFQPHQHSRTRHLLEEFANSFSQADLVIVPHIYFVRDSQEEKQRVAAGDLVDRLREKGVKAMHLYPFEAIIDHLRETSRAGDVVVVMGAGDVWKIGKGYLESPLM